MLSWGWRPRRIALLELFTDSLTEIFDRVAGNEAGEGLAAPNADSVYQSGAQGRPTSMRLIAAELERRRAASQALTTLAAESEALAAWLVQSHPEAPSASAKTIRNSLADLLRASVSQTVARKDRPK